MVEGWDDDDGWCMVEDELFFTAKQFTAHLHHAEYQRLKTKAQAQTQQNTAFTGREVDERVEESVYTKMKMKARANRAKADIALRDASLENSESEEDAPFMKDPKLAEVMGDMGARSSARPDFVLRRAPSQPITNQSMAHEDNSQYRYETPANGLAQERKKIEEDGWIGRPKPIRHEQEMKPPHRDEGDSGWLGPPKKSRAEDSARGTVRRNNTNTDTCSQDLPVAEIEDDDVAPVRKGLSTKMAAKFARQKAAKIAADTESGAGDFPTFLH